MSLVFPTGFIIAPPTATRTSNVLLSDGTNTGSTSLATLFGLVQQADIKDAFSSSGSNVNFVSITTNATGTAPVIAANSTVDTNVNLTLSARGSGNVVSTSNFSTPTQSITGGGGLSLINGTSNLISFINNGFGTPAFTTRSLGTKIVLYNGIDGSDVDVALGVNSGVFWLSVPNSSNNFIFYAGQTQVASISGSGAGSFIGLTSTGSLILQTVVVTTGATYSVLSTDYVVVINKGTGSATGVTLPSSPAIGRTLVIKDGKGDANTNNITLTPAAGNIDGTTTKVINTAFGVLRICYNGTQWNSI